MWSFGAIKQSLNEIASEDTANKKLWILWRYVKIKRNAIRVSLVKHLDKIVLFFCAHMYYRNDTA